jgi:GNAT superfamily N-acetyltransferase
VDKNGIASHRHKRSDAPASSYGRAAPPIVSAASAVRTERSIEEASNFAAEVKERYPGITLHLSGSSFSDFATLSLISIPESMRGQGIATKVMQEIIDEADSNGWNIALSPSADFGSSKARLVKFYQRFGFVANSGRNKDYAVSETMLRLADD